MISRFVLLGGALAASVASADDLPSPGVPLAQLRDEQLAQTLTAITQDPAVRVDPHQRTVAHALLIEGVKQLQTKAYDQALANFLEAYSTFPSPKILLAIGSILRDMGRLADAANTYQRYLADPGTGAERVAAVEELLVQLDAQLAILTIRVAPPRSAISIDAGAFIPVGSTLVTRVRPGLHLIRIRNSDKSAELTVNGFEGERKEVLAAIPLEAPLPVVDSKRPAPPDHQDGWLITGQYGHGGGNQRTTLASPAGEPIRAIVPVLDARADDTPPPPPRRAEISSGILAVLRIDAEGRGFAGGLGLAISRGKLEGDVLVLRSNQTGGYLGARYRFLSGFFRPYAAAGIPGFVFDTTTTVNDMEVTETKLAIGARVAAGVELSIHAHLSVQVDMGYEHFWFVDGTPFVSNVYVPTVGVIGRL